MNESFKEALEILISNYYIMPINGELVISNKFYRELEEVDPKELFQKEEPVNLPAEFPDVPKVVRELITVNAKSKIPIVAEGKTSPFSQFIMDCEVPTKAVAGDGRKYWVNKYSKEAEKEFAIILNQGYQLDILKNATKLYYKSGGMVEAISNFIIRGTWMTHYQEMKLALEKGTAEQHIKENLREQTGGAAIYNDR